MICFPCCPLWWQLRILSLSPFFLLGNRSMPNISNFNLSVNAWENRDCKWWKLVFESNECWGKTIASYSYFFYSAFWLYSIGFLKLQINECVMENEAYGLAGAFVARRTTDLTLLLEMVSRNQNRSRHDDVTMMGAEVRKIEYNIAFKWGDWYCLSGTMWPIGSGTKGVVHMTHQTWRWDRSFHWLRHRN